MTVDECTRAAMALSTGERAALVTELLSSLEPAVDVEASEIESAWENESERRARDVLGGGVNGEEFEAVCDRLLGGIPGER